MCRCESKLTGSKKWSQPTEAALGKSCRDGVCRDQGCQDDGSSSFETSSEATSRCSKCRTILGDEDNVVIPEGNPNDPSLGNFFLQCTRCARSGGQDCSSLYSRSLFMPFFQVAPDASAHSQSNDVTDQPSESFQFFPFSSDYGFCEASANTQSPEFFVSTDVFSSCSQPDVGLPPRRTEDGCAGLEAQQRTLGWDGVPVASATTCLPPTFADSPIASQDSPFGIPGCAGADPPPEFFLPTFCEEVEDATHVAFMLRCHTRKCEQFSKGHCAMHKPMVCFDYHFDSQRRRGPVTDPDPKTGKRSLAYWEVPCEFLSHPLQCPRGTKCPFAHSKDEISYHPSKFKTRFCNGRGCCHKICCFAHGQQDLRAAAIVDRYRYTPAVSPLTVLDCAAPRSSVRAQRRLLGSIVDSRLKSAVKLGVIVDDHIKDLRPITQASIANIPLTPIQPLSSPESPGTDGALLREFSKVLQRRHRSGKEVGSTASSDLPVLALPLVRTTPGTMVSARSTAGTTSSSTPWPSSSLPPASTPTTFREYASPTETIPSETARSRSTCPSPGCFGYSNQSVFSQEQQVIPESHLLDVFKVEECQQKWLSHDRKNCPYFHGARDRRRYPISYSPHPCTVQFDSDCLNTPLKEIEGPVVHLDSSRLSGFNSASKSCPEKDACQFSHNRVELLYHPSVYKQRFCSAYPDASKCGRKKTCAFAHTRQEILSPLLSEEQELDRSDRMFCYHFKTLWCPYGVQHDWHRCVYAHTYQDCRRVPRVGYGSEPCPLWDRGSSTARYDERCPQGVRCPHSHGSKEQLYHPHYYKTNRCNDWSKTGMCPRGEVCAFYHDASERREPPKESAGVDYSLPLLGAELRLQPNFHRPPLFHIEETAAAAAAACAAGGGAETFSVPLRGDTADRFSFSELRTLKHTPPIFAYDASISSVSAVPSDQCCPDRSAWGGLRTAATQCLTAKYPEPGHAEGVPSSPSFAVSPLVSVAMEGFERDQSVTSMALNEVPPFPQFSCWETMPHHPQEEERLRCRDTGRRQVSQKNCRL